MTAGLEGLKVADPTDGALAQARGRVGAEPLQWLFDLLRGPAPGIGTPGVWWRGLLVCAIDGTTMSVPDSPANLTGFTKQRCNNGGSRKESKRCFFRPGSLSLVWGYRARCVGSSPYGSRSCSRI